MTLPTGANPDAIAESKPRPGSEWLDAWHVNPSLNKDYDVIDGLRGIAILLVVASHLFYFNPQSGQLIQFVGGIVGAGAWGVTVFFTLSGFLISYPFWKNKAQGTSRAVPSGYARRRFWKIYPPLALSIVLLVPVYIALNGQASAYLAVAGQWLIGWPFVHPVSSRVNPAMWSLIVEVHFYVVLPLLFLALKRFSIRHCVWIIFLVLLIVPTGLRWWNFFRGVDSQLHPEIKMLFPTRLDAFAFGVLVAGLENLQVIRKSWAWLGDAGCILLVVTMPILSWLGLHPIASHRIQLESLTWVVKIASGLMLCYVADPGHPRARLFSAPWLRWCGLISYEWYLFHQPIALWSRALFGPAHGNVPKYLVIVCLPLLAGLIIAAIVYRCFSLPLLRYGRSRRGVL